MEVAVSSCTRALDHPDVPLLISSVKFAINIILDLVIISKFHVHTIRPTVNTQAVIRLACDLSSAVCGLVRYLETHQSMVDIPPDFFAQEIRRASQRLPKRPKMLILKSFPAILHLHHIKTAKTIQWSRRIHAHLSPSSSSPHSAISIHLHRISSTECSLSVAGNRHYLHERGLRHSMGRFQHHQMGFGHGPSASTRSIYLDFRGA